jgi:hypothetical protein
MEPNVNMRFIYVPCARGPEVMLYKVFNDFMHETVSWCGFPCDSSDQCSRSVRQ